jgi:glycosyltransferase involved in cell wall biosynthesis
VRVLVLAYDGELNPSTRLRILQYVPALARNGVEVSTLFLERQGRARAFGRRLDRALSDVEVVFVQRVLTREVVRRLSRSRLPVIFDLDDAVHYIRESQYPRTLSPTNTADKVRNVYRSVLRGSRFHSSRKRLLDKMLDIATTTIVGNQWLFEELGLNEDRAVIIPTSVWLHGVPTKRHGPHRPVVVGWIGVKSNLYHLDALSDAFAALHERYKDEVELKIVSSATVKTPLVTRFVPWSLESESASVLSFDIGIMPLHDDPFSRGKCAFKAVFCMSRGVPVVASPVGANTALIEHGVNGWLASSTDDWIHGISVLAEDTEARARMGRLARKTIEDRYSAADVAENLSQVLRRVADPSLGSVVDI